MAPQKPLTIIARVQAKPGQAENLLAAQKELVAAVVSEPGCLKYEPHISNEHPGLVIFVESWENYDLWQEHMAAPALQAFRKRAGDLIESVAIDQLTPVY
jgi:quinol monooxygenase YgiN